MKSCHFVFTLVFALPMIGQAQTSSKEQLELMMGMQYVDQQKCYLGFNDMVLPVIPLLATAFNEAQDNTMRNRVIEAFETALLRGCSIDALDTTGLTALNQAVLYNNTQLAELALKHGANPNQTIELMGVGDRATRHFKDSFALLKRLEEVAPDIDRSVMAEILASYSH